MSASPPVPVLPFYVTSKVNEKLADEFYVLFPPDRPNAMALDPTPDRDRDVDTDSGKAVIRAFCGTCGTPIRSWPEDNTDVTALRAGLFAKTNQDGTAEAAAGNSGFVYPAPISELYTERRNHQFPWVAPQDGAKEWPRMEKFE
ncbi:hypothetical protein OC861_005980 [Tilletia horrida]|nr:hypothetical protein OC861_005980 [Tilletia horrida]